MLSIETEQFQEKMAQVKAEMADLKKAIKEKESAILAAKKKEKQSKQLHDHDSADLFIERKDKAKVKAANESVDKFDKTPGDHVLVEL